MEELTAEEQAYLDACEQEVRDAYGEDVNDPLIGETVQSLVRIALGEND